MELSMEAPPKDKVLTLLRDDKEKVIVLAGESGIGKTWMAKEISRSAVEEKLFQFTLWEYLTEAAPEAKATSEVRLQHIARQLSLLPIVEEYEVEQEDDVDTEEEKQANSEPKRDGLKAEILKMLDHKKVLFIVDDLVGSELNEQKIWDGFKTLLDSYLDFKVLICSTKPVPQSKNVVDLKPLSLEVTLELLTEKVGSSLLDDPVVKSLSEDFIKMEKFKKIPSSISLLGKVLSCFKSDKDSAIRMLKSVIEEASCNENYDIKQILRNEYAKLPNCVLSILMDCNWSGKHFYRESGSVHYNELIAYWMVEGLLGHFGSIEKAYEVGHSVLMELLEYQVLKSLDDGCVKIDETKLNMGERHRLGFCATANLGLATVIEDRKTVFGKITQANGVMKTLCGREKGQKLSTLMLDGNGFCWEQLLEMLQQKETIEELEVLALFNRKLESLLETLLEFASSFLKLHVLLLRDCVSQMVTTPILNLPTLILNLPNLVVLEISGTSSLNALPEDFFRKTPNLQSINLSSLPIELLPESLYGLKKLKWLILRGCLQLKELESVKAMENLMVLDLSNSTSFNLFKDKTFLANPKLQVLNASNTAIKCIPLVKNLSKLTHLLLSGCTEMDRLRKMETLTSLQVLDLSGSTIFRVLRDQSLENKDHLEIVDFSGTRIKELPTDISDHRQLYLKGCLMLTELPFIEKLERLEVLDVSGTVCLEKIEDNFFDKLQKLRIINLSHTGIKTLPSISNVIELRELLLSNCLNLEMLPALNSLKKLEVLDASGCISLKELQDSPFENMTSLCKLDLSETKIECLPSIPSPSHLRQLLLRNCTELKIVPSLDSQLELEELNLHGVRSFGGAGASCLKNMTRLIILDLSETSVQELPDFSSFTNLKSLSLSSCEIKRVPGLESLTMLEALDLSSTKIASLPSLESFNNLRQLLLRDCSSLKEFINIKILDLFGAGARVEELPYGISKLKYLDRLDLPENKEVHVQVAEDIEEYSNQYLWRIISFLHENSVSITNILFAKIFSEDASLWERNFSNFHFLIEPVEGQYKNGYHHFNRDELALLKDVYFQDPQFSLFEGKRMVEIRGFKQPPQALNDILKHTDCLYLVDNMFKKWLSSLGAANLEVIRGCWIERCNEIETVFQKEEKDQNSLVAKTLECLSVSHAAKLTSIYDGDMSEFSTLKYVYLDSCPNLSTLFVSSTQLPQSLKVVHIKFCDKLVTLFEDCTLPNLESLHLREIQRLEKIGSHLPSLKTLKIWDCPLLKNVLSSEQPANNLETLEVGGCEKLINLFENGTSVENKLPRLITLTLKELPEFKSIRCNLPSAQTLKVLDCPSLLNVTASSAPLNALKTLEVSYCDEMVSLFEHEASSDYNLKMLKTLHLLELPKLVKFGAKFPLLAQENFVINGMPWIRALSSANINSELLAEVRRHKPQFFAGDAVGATS